jgi:hypothetical protein
LPLPFEGVKLKRTQLSTALVRSPVGQSVARYPQVLLPAEPTASLGPRSLWFSIMPGAIVSNQIVLLGILM